MYNSHRGMGPGPQHGGRLAELLDQVRQEFDAQAGRSSEHEHQSESLAAACGCAAKQQSYANQTTS